MSHAGVVLLRQVADKTGLTAGLSRALASQRLLVHERGRLAADLASAIADGAEVISDLRVLTDQRELSGLVASVPTAWRTLSGRAPGAGTDHPGVSAARRQAWAAIVARDGAIPGVAGRGQGDQGVIRLRQDVSVVACHSETESAAPTWKKTFGLLPLAAFADHGASAAGEALAIMLRPGNAGSNTASEHIDVTRLALAQLPRRLPRKVLIRTDSGGGTRDFLAWLTGPGRRLHYSNGMTITEDMHQAILTLPDRIWEPAYDAGGQVRQGAMGG